MLMTISLDFSYRENVSHDGMSNEKKNTEWHAVILTQDVQVVEINLIYRNQFQHFI